MLERGCANEGDTLLSSTPRKAVLTGRFSGDGRWTDITGESRRYRIDFLEFGEVEGLVTLSFVHDLYEENDRVDAEFCFEFENESQFALLSSKGTGHAKIGTGYAFDNYCQYLLVIGETLVENRMVFVGDTLRIFGSSSKNKAGRFIRWEETLARVK